MRVSCISCSIREQKSSAHCSIAGIMMLGAIYTAICCLPRLGLLAGAHRGTHLQAHPQCGEGQDPRHVRGGPERAGFW